MASDCSTIINVILTKARQPYSVWPGVKLTDAMTRIVTIALLFIYTIMNSEALLRSALSVGNFCSVSDFEPQPYKCHSDSAVTWYDDGGSSLEIWIL
jgi:hypothetical protein